jgi:hypothetical protein
VIGFVAERPDRRDNWNEIAETILLLHNPHLQGQTAKKAFPVLAKVGRDPLYDSERRKALEQPT